MGDSMKKLQNRQKDLPQPEELKTRETERSEELLSQVLVNDFCEFGSSEVIGGFLRERSCGKF
jgi:hypothetical protein